MKTKIDIKRWDNNNIIFSYACENNTIKKTVEEAVKQGVSLAYADLSMISLEKMNLKGIDLSYANLFKANLSRTILSNADLTYAVLSYADLSEANLNGTNLAKANLNNAKLINADLYQSNLGYTYCFNNIILDSVKGLNDQCPKEGSFIGWKKCIGADKKYYIVKLEIPEDAKRSSSTTNKCRCSKAKVLNIENVDGTKADVNEVGSWLFFAFKYKVGEIVEVPNFDERYWLECAPGIHFFMNRGNAIIFN